MSHTRQTYLGISALLVIVIFLFAACSNSESNTKSVHSFEKTQVAQVGSAVITNFMLERELKFGIDKEVAIEQLLDWKIKEHLIAQSLREKGFDQEDAFLDARKAFKHEALVEETFQKEVSNKTVVTDTEIKEEIAKRNVRFAFRFFPLNNREEGIQKRDYWLNTSYEDLVETSFVNMNEVAAFSVQWQSPLVEAYDIDAELLTVLQDLEIGVPSQPINYQGKWMLFEVTDIRRKPIGDWEMDEQRESAKKVVWNRKAMHNATVYVDSLMQPLAVRTDRNIFNRLSELLYPLFKEQTPVRTLAYLSKNDALYRERLATLSGDGEMVLSSWKGGKLTIDDFFEEWIPGVYPLRFQNKTAFENALSDAIALLVRDKQLLQIAKKKKLAENDSLKAELTLREDKWLFQQYKNRQLNQLLADSKALENWYITQTKKRQIDAISFMELPEDAKLRLARRLLAFELNKEADSLSKIIAVKRDGNVLTELANRLNKESAKKSADKFKMVQLFKNYANRPAWPAIDPIWLQLPS